MDFGLRTLVIGSLCFALGGACFAQSPKSKVQSPKYVFLFIGDGMSTPQRMASEDFSRICGHGPLAMNALPCVGTSRTASANALVTDSAAAATAMGCGEKAENGALGVAPDGARLESAAEVAHRRGMKVGIATTVTVCHATPAGFYAHRRNRGLSYQIGLDLIASGFEFFAAGGLGGRADDKKDPLYRGSVYDLAAAAGYSCLSDAAAFRALKPGCGKVWARFAEGALPFAIDADAATPSLAEITAKGIELLDNPDGFFFMVEGGKVDYAGHANDAATSVREILALDDAVRVGLAFAERHPAETLVVVTGDHETGGLSMGFAGTGRTIDLGALTNQTCSVEKFSADFRKRLAAQPDRAFAEEIPLLEKAFGFRFDAAFAKDRMFISPDERKQLEDAFANDVAFVQKKVTETKRHDVKRVYAFGNTAKRIMSAKTGVGWSTGSHTSLPTLTTAKGAGAERFMGLYENADVGRRLKELLQCK